MKFNYKEVNGRMRPIIPVVLKHKQKAVNIYAIVDSGADVCIFPAEIAEFLDIDLQSGTKEEVAGIVAGQKRPYYLHEIMLSVGGWENKIIAGFMPEISRLGYSVLGQNGFFTNFIVKFDYSKGEIDIKPRS